LAVSEKLHLWGDHEDRTKRETKRGETGTKRTEGSVTKYLETRRDRSGEAAKRVQKVV